MYSLKRKFKWIQKRLYNHSEELKPSETFVLTVFMIEKLLRRCLMQLMVSACFTREEALEILRGIRGLEAIKDSWRFYEPQHQELPLILGNDLWSTIQTASKERNRLVHGIDHKSEKNYRRYLSELLNALDKTHATLEKVYGFGGWDGFNDRAESLLHSDPKIKKQGESK